MGKKNIIIVGGELQNKGAQAMVFTVVNEIKERFSGYDIFLFSNLDYRNMSDNEKEKYTFKIFPSRSYDILKNKINIFQSNSNELNEKIKDIIEDTIFVIDINGYALTSQFNVNTTKYYLSNIALFKKYNVDIYLLPQSFGPFNYKLFWKLLFYPLLFKYLKYPRKIYCREEAGFKALNKFTSKNLEKSFDIVLTKNKINMNNIYKNKVKLDKIKLHSNSVGIIPNLNLKRYNSENDILEMYYSIINFLLEKHMKVYILRHSYQDLDFCREIKAIFSDRNDVILISKDFNVFELNYIIRQFDFIIGSRYHSIIHSYKNQRPALILGWALKYYEIVKLFNQEMYCFDIRGKIKRKNLMLSLEKLLVNYTKESKIIKDRLDSIIKNNIFDDIFSSY